MYPYWHTVSHPDARPILRLAEGQPNAARRQLERCIEAVGREFGVAPETRTAALLSDEGGEAPEAPRVPAAPLPEAEIGRAHVCTPVPNAHLVCRLLLAKKKSAPTTTHSYHDVNTF